MKFKIKFAVIIVFYLSILIVADSCSMRDDYKKAEVLFSEILRAEKPIDGRIVENKWLCMDVLGNAYQMDSDSIRTRLLFQTFYLSLLDLPVEEYSSHTLAIVQEYAGNLLISAPSEAVILCFYDEIYYMIRYNQEIMGIKKNIPVININYLPLENYQEYIEGKYSFDLPNGIVRKTWENSRDNQSVKRLAVDSLSLGLNRPIFIDMNLPLEFRPRENWAIWGIGKVYGYQIENEKLIEENLALFEDKLVFEKLSDSLITYPNMVGGMIQWYSDAPIYNAMDWYNAGDSLSARVLSKILINRLPNQWKPATFYIRLNSDLPDSTRTDLINRVRNYIRYNSESRGARNALKPLAQTE